MRRTAVIAAVAAGLLAIPAAASAHPAFNPSELPPGETVESKLVVPHGCAPGGGMPEPGEDGGEAEPTVELAVQHTEAVTLEPMDVEGWQVADDGEAWVWTDDGGATTDVIEFPVMLTLDASAAAGDEIYLRAYQECVDGSSFQWVGTPDEEASFPAIRLAASEGGADTVEPDEDATMDHGDMDMGEDGEMSEDDMAEEMATEEPTAEDTGDDLDEDMAMEDEEAASDGGLSTPLIVLLVLIALGAVAALVLRNRTS